VSRAGPAYHARMSIFLDDEPVQLAGANLAELIASASKHLADDGRVVVEVMLDGSVLNADEMGQRRNSPLDDAEVRMVSADPRALAVSTLYQVRDLLPKATQLHEQAAEFLQQDNPSEALKLLAEVIEVWLQTQEAVLGSAGVVGLSLDAVKVDDVPMSDFTDELIKMLQGLKDLIVAGDTVALADTLAYEWPPIVDRWDELIGVLVEKIESMS
jgi:hypothetical protein